jgi:hypothetical protein
MARFMTLLHLARAHAPAIVALAIAVLSLASTGGGDFPRRI